MVIFLLGGFIGVLLVSLLLDFYVIDSYFVVVYFYYVLFGMIVFVIFVGIYFWFFKMIGWLFDEWLGKLYFWLMFIGFYIMFLVQYWLGDEGMLCCYVDYLFIDGFQGFNVVLMIGVFILGVLMFLFVWNVFKSWCYGEVVIVDDLWGYGNLLEWVISCLLLWYNFIELFCICFECFVFELYYLYMVECFCVEVYVGCYYDEFVMVILS